MGRRIRGKYLAVDIGSNSAKVALVRIGCDGATVHRIITVGSIRDFVKNGELVNMTDFFVMLREILDQHGITEKRLLLTTTLLKIATRTERKAIYLHRQHRNVESLQLYDEVFGLASYMPPELLVAVWKACDSAGFALCSVEGTHTALANCSGVSCGILINIGNTETSIIGFVEGVPIKIKDYTSDFGGLESQLMESVGADSDVIRELLINVGLDSSVEYGLLMTTYALSYGQVETYFETLSRITAGRICETRQCAESFLKESLMERMECVVRVSGGFADIPGLPRIWPEAEPILCGKVWRTPKYAVRNRTGMTIGSEFVGVLGLACKGQYRCSANLLNPAKDRALRYNGRVLQSMTAIVLTIGALCFSLYVRNNALKRDALILETKVARQVTGIYEQYSGVAENAMEQETVLPEVDVSYTQEAIALMALLEGIDISGLRITFLSANQEWLTEQRTEVQDLFGVNPVNMRIGGVCTTETGLNELTAFLRAETSYLIIVDTGPEGRHPPENEGEFSLLLYGNVEGTVKG